MIFLIPIRTDAPIYHWPWATLLLIVVNVGTFFLTGYGDPDNFVDWQHWVLEFGNGLNPLEWITCHFLHFGILHLLANIIFLWGFGLVVEGKIGWWRYLLVYFGIGILGAFLIQLAMLGYRGDAPGAGGASLIIFGLLAMSTVWAPKNEVTCLFFFIYRGFFFDVTILAFSIYYLAVQIIFAAFQMFAISGQVAHLVGAALGFAVGVVMLKRNWVDCENWDLFAVMNGTYGSTQHRDALGLGTAGGPIATAAGTGAASQSTGTEVPGDDEPLDFEENIRRQTTHQSKTRRKMRELLQAGKPRAALSEYQKLKHLLTSWQLEERELQALADGLYKVKAFAEAVPLMEEFILRFPAQATRTRLKLAGVAIEVQQRPRYALRLLDEVPPETLTKKLAGHVRKMQRVAQQMIEEGVIELDGQAFR